MGGNQRSRLIKTFLLWLGLLTATSSPVGALTVSAVIDRARDYLRDTSTQVNRQRFNDTILIRFINDCSEDLMDRVMTLKPEAVYLAGFYQGIGAMIQELRRLKYRGRLLTTSAFALPSSIAKVGKDAAGVILTQSVFDLDSEHSHVQKFVKGYEEKYGERPDIYAAHGYDAMRVVAAALAGRKALASEVIKGLRAVKDFPGVTGSIQFDEKGDVRKFPRLYIIGEDLLLYDYSERVRKQQEEIRRRRAALREKLERLDRQAKEMNN